MITKQRRITQAYFNIARVKYDSLVHRLSRRVGIDSSHIEELSLRGEEELLKCMICYDGRGSFITFLYHRLFGLFRHLRDAEIRSKRMHGVSLDPSNCTSTSYDNAETHITVQDCLACLTDKERNIIIELFFNNKTIRETASSYSGIPSTICRIKSRAIGKMKRRCEMELR